MDDVDRDFTLRPKQKFRPAEGKAIMTAVLNEILTGELYSDSTSAELGNRVAVEIRSRLKGFTQERYKFIVQVHISEQRGQSAHIAAQCVWDADSDVCTHAFFSSNSLWCQATTFAVFYY